MPPPVRKEDLPALGAPGTGVISGTHKFCTLPGEGKFFGTGGCETCVGLIVVCDGGKGAIFHFTTDDKAQSTLAKYDWSNEKGCKAYIFGGNDERGSKNLFDEVFNWSSRLFGKKNVFVIDASAAYVNSKGEIVVRPPAK